MVRATQNEKEMKNYEETVACYKQERAARKVKPCYYGECNMESFVERTRNPIAVFYSGGYPTVCKRTVETHWPGDSGYDFARVAIVIDGEVDWNKDCDLLSEYEVKEVERIAKSL